MEDPLTRRYYPGTGGIRQILFDHSEFVSRWKKPIAWYRKSADNPGHALQEHYVHYSTSACVFLRIAKEKGDTFASP